jgi:hypothetical protein
VLGYLLLAINVIVAVVLFVLTVLKIGGFNPLHHVVGWFIDGTPYSLGNQMGPGKTHRHREHISPPVDAGPTVLHEFRSLAPDRPYDRGAAPATRPAWQQVLGPRAAPSTHAIGYASSYHPCIQHSPIEPEGTGAPAPTSTPASASSPRARTHKRCTRNYGRRALTPERDIKSRTCCIQRSHAGLSRLSVGFLGLLTWVP